MTLESQRQSLLFIITFVKVKEMESESPKVPVEQPEHSNSSKINTSPTRFPAQVFFCDTPVPSVPSAPSIHLPNSKMHASSTTFVSTFPSFGQISLNNNKDQIKMEQNVKNENSTNLSDKVNSALRKRYTAFPIEHHDLWDMCLKQRRSFWVVEEISLDSDLEHWNNRLSNNDRQFIKTVLAFFAASDGIVAENLVHRFQKDIDVFEVNYFYAFQNMMEMIHSETYSILIDTYIKDPQEKDQMFHAIETHPAIKRKAEWALHWLNNDAPFLQRLVAFACVEGIFFSSSFCSIFWLKKRGLMPGLAFSNELISRDEGMHEQFACHLFLKICRGELIPLGLDTNHLEIPTIQKVHEIVKSAVECESFFVQTALPEDIVGMNSRLMIQYVQLCADVLLVFLGMPKLYNVSSPFEWMELISLEGKTNFFERKVGEYQHTKSTQNFMSSSNTTFGSNPKTTQSSIRSDFSINRKFA